MNKIYLYWPNLIGYVRIILLILSFTAFITDCPIKGVFSYLISQLMDAVDGHVARMFNQSTDLGAALDMLTDRISTLCIYLLLAARSPHLLWLVIILAVGDITGHWSMIIAQYKCGKESHKQVDKALYLLKLYYSVRPLMFCLHGCYEVCLCIWLILTYSSHILLIRALLRFSLVLLLLPAATKSIINYMHIHFAANSLVEHETKKSS